VGRRRQDKQYRRDCGEFHDLPCGMINHVRRI
jgi:hypothetical protein